MPYSKPENTYVVRFRKKPETALARRTLVIMGILTVPIVVLHFMVPMKEDGVSLLGLWLLVLVVVLLQCRIWLDSSRRRYFQGLQKRQMGRCSPVFRNNKGAHVSSDANGRETDRFRETTMGNLRG